MQCANRKMIWKERLYNRIERKDIIIMKEVEDEKYIGVTIDNKLCFDGHLFLLRVTKLVFSIFPHISLMYR